MIRKRVSTGCARSTSSIPGSISSASTCSPYHHSFHPHIEHHPIYTRVRFVGLLPCEHIAGIEMQGNKLTEPVSLSLAGHGA